jgi:inner membrane protein
MDNLCHTLTGFAMGEAGLKHQTRYGNAALMIAANLPDVDVLVFLTDTPSVEFRRGWTHGLLAQLVLPLLLTAAVVVYDRLRRRHTTATIPLNIPWLLGLCYAGIASHVGLDFLNNYGVRLLAPFDWRWFYGDAVFIADIWLWLALGAGVWLSRRRGTPAPARGALMFAAAYVIAMLVSAQVARGIVATIWRTARDTEPRSLMVGPLPVTPLTRAVILDAGDHYETGTFSWWSASVTFSPERIPKNADDPAVSAAQRTRLISAYLAWARFPYWIVQPENGAVGVRVGDVRFANALGGRLTARVVIRP